MNLHSLRVRTAICGPRYAVTAGAVAVDPEVAAAAPGSASTYVVLYKEGSSSADAQSTVSAAGGSVVANYTKIGVVIARSASASFASDVQMDSKVSAAARTDGFATSIGKDQGAGGDAAAAAAVAATWGDSLSGRQWDMEQIHVPEAHAITGGDRSVVVGDIDTGLDYTHPDLAPNVDFAKSASCIGGAPNTSPAAWADDNGHGTHTAGTIAAAANGIGIVGVAPNVRIAGIKAGNAAGFFFPEAVICAFMWAASTASTSPTTATSPIPGCSTARTTRSSGRSGPPSDVRSSSLSPTGPSSSPPQATRPTTCRTPPRTRRARTTRRR